MGQILAAFRSQDDRGTETTWRGQARSLARATWLWIMLLTMGGVTGAEQDRKLIKKVDPEYPAIARKLTLSGTVRVEVNIAPDGNVKSVSVLGGNPVLSQAVEQAVKQWKYASGAAEKKILEFKF